MNGTRLSKHCLAKDSSLLFQHSQYEANDYVLPEGREDGNTETVAEVEGSQHPKYTEDFAWASDHDDDADMSGSKGSESDGNSESGEEQSHPSKPSSSSPVPASSGQPKSKKTALASKKKSKGKKAASGKDSRSSDDDAMQVSEAVASAVELMSGVEDFSAQIAAVASDAEQQHTSGGDDDITTRMASLQAAAQGMFLSFGFSMFSAYFSISTDDDEAQDVVPELSTATPRMLFIVYHSIVFNCSLALKQCLHHQKPISAAGPSSCQSSLSVHPLSQGAKPKVFFIIYLCSIFLTLIF